MTELSPAAYAVLSAVTQQEYSLDPEDIPQLAASISSSVSVALCAAVDQLGFVDDYGTRLINSDDLLAISNELKALS